MKFLCGDSGIVPGQFSAPSRVILWCISHGDVQVVSSMMLQAALWWSLIEPGDIPVLIAKMKYTEDQAGFAGVSTSGAGAQGRFVHEQAFR
jgi:hypothetical protein